MDVEENGALFEALGRETKKLSGPTKQRRVLKKCGYRADHPGELYRRQSSIDFDYIHKIQCPELYFRTWLGYWA